MGLGALESGYDWVLGVLIISGLLNAAYFLPLLYRGWFAVPSRDIAQAPRRALGRECHWMMLWPAVFTAGLALAVGLLAGLDISPLAWARFIVEREFDV